MTILIAFVGLNEVIPLLVFVGMLLFYGGTLKSGAADRAA